jgi:hypothetical protein
LAELEHQQKDGYNTLDRNACVTEIFVPYFHFGGKPLSIQVNVGECEYDEEKQTFYHFYERKSELPIDLITISLGVLTDTNTAAAASNGYSCNLM